jgi:TatA/E family protein of Tat protein translocase
MLAIFQSFGLPELGVILLIALVLFGPSKLPQIGKSVGKALREFRESSTEVTKAIQEGVHGVPEHKVAAAPVVEAAPKAPEAPKAEESAEVVESDSTT